MPISLRGSTNSSFRLGAGNVTNPSLAFVGNPSTGLFLQNGNIGVSVNGTETMRITSSGILVNGNVTANTLVGDGSSLTNTSFNTSVSNVQVANSTYTVLDDTAVDTAGGFVVVNGSGFIGGSMVLVGGTPASSTVALSYTQLGAQVPAKAAGTYSVTVVRPDSVSINVPLGITYSPSPVWSTATTLPNVYKYTDFTQTLAATSDSAVTYSGSSLPPGVSLSTSGVLIGNITTDPGNTTVYSFVVQATDAQFQNIPRTFGLTALTTPVVASGGTVTTSGLYTIHTFTTSGSFTLSNPASKTFEVLVVAGGGGGGGGHAGGGGGGGGFLTSAGVSAPSGTYTITVGGGGVGGTGPSPLAGSNSSGFTLTAIGGGLGGQESYNPGGNGGSGGGGCGDSNTTRNVAGSGTLGQGYAGGNGNNTIGSGFGVGGGGGGAGQVGANATNSGGGNGGNGLSSSITGTSVYYAGGGGGGGWSGAVYGGIGGLGGGGYSVSGGAGLPGTANTGGGGAGSDAGTGGMPRYGGAGGSGIVIIRYLT